MTQSALKTLTLITLFSSGAQAAVPTPLQGNWKPEQVLCDGTMSSSTAAVKNMSLAIDASQVAILSAMPPADGRQCRGVIRLGVLNASADTVKLGHGQFAIECLNGSQWKPTQTGAISREYQMRFEPADANTLKLSTQIEQGSAFADCKVGQTATLVLKRN